MCRTVILVFSVLIALLAIFIVTQTPTKAYDWRFIPLHYDSEKRVVIPLPKYGFDPTEVAVPWKVLTILGHQVVFATEDGQMSDGADKVVLNGCAGGLVKVFPRPAELYDEMIHSPEYRKPAKWQDITTESFDGFLVPGGHDAGINQMLNSPLLMEKLRDFWPSGKPVAAICHGTLLPARAGLLKHNVKSTTLPKYLEWQAWTITKYLAGLGDYQMNTTYPLYTADEIRQSMADPDTQYIHGPFDLLAPLYPGTEFDHTHAFAVEDGSYISARFWGDAWVFSGLFARQLAELDTEAGQARLAEKWRYPIRKPDPNAKQCMMPANVVPPPSAH
eukprot:gnl/Spiro4/23822_TR11784_c0_g2_i1.p1 gnl/Spiro4/23822_TR11784_c0_g2~~gnl/Spiro4/23822_TR11784_c0_g2_i1.p1  ORF type:complete len:345 (+),score=64.95 gnl/Spiro4/23822_TR11784_c0_g2_i1:42-1037(+)